MKKLFLLSVIIFLLPIVLGDIISTPRITIETVHTDPYPLEPGDTFVLTLEILNNGSKKAEDVVLELESVYPFTLLEESKKEIKNIYEQDTRIIDYKMLVDSSAASATYELPLYLTYDTYYKIKKNVEIRVQGSPDFKILNVDSETISPGDRADILVKIQNVGTGKAKKTTATLSSSSEYVKPVLSGGNVYIGDVQSDEIIDIKFNVLASSDSEYGVYTAHVNLTYEDELGDDLEKKFDIGILISGEPKFQIIKTEVKGVENELEIEITNIGTAEAKAITGKLMIGDKIVDVDYVTSVKIDKRTTLKFNLPSSTKADLELSYEGPDNEEYTQTEIVVWNIPFSIPTWIWIIVILIIVYVFWKKKWYKKIL
jgi:hypothetical protein